jgi:hypothetical protein
MASDLWLADMFSRLTSTTKKARTASPFRGEHTHQSSAFNDGFENNGDSRNSFMPCCTNNTSCGTIGTTS